VRLDYVKALKQRETIPRIAAMIVHRDNLIKKTKSGVDKLTCIISDGSADVTMTILGAKVRERGREGEREGGGGVEERRGGGVGQV
jgi:hypothetical protein